MTFKYKEKTFSSMDLLMELVKDYGVCPKCGNEKVGGSPSVGSMHYDGEHGTFERTCKCGWSTSLKVAKCKESKKK